MYNGLLSPGEIYRKKEQRSDSCSIPSQAAFSRAWCLRKQGPICFSSCCNSLSSRAGSLFPLEGPAPVCPLPSPGGPRTLSHAWNFPSYQLPKETPADGPASLAVDTHVFRRGSGSMCVHLIQVFIYRCAGVFHGAMCNTCSPVCGYSVCVHLCVYVCMSGWQLVPFWKGHIRMYT